MRIAQVAPLYESVPPKLYGAIQRVVAWLTDELVRQGHEVTLFASGDSSTQGQLHAACKQGLRHDNSCADKFLPHMLTFEALAEMSEHFDVIHFHTDYLHLPWLHRFTAKVVTTLHKRLDLPPLAEYMDKFPCAIYVAISQAQRHTLPSLNWCRTIHHGMPDLYSFQKEPGNYLLFLGRMSPYKRPDRAIEIACRFGMTLKIAAKIGEIESTYYNEVIEPLIAANPLVEYIGEVDDAAKNELIGNAYALVHPVEFPEPFGLVLIEALACGTPVVAFGNGAIAEIIDDGMTGFVCHSIDQAVEALHKLPGISRQECRKQYEERFSVSRMTRDYLSVYAELCG